MTGLTGDLAEADRAWDAAWLSMGVAAPEGLLERVTAAYAEPARAYHSAQHLAECFRHFAEVRDQLDRPAEVALALWFHDAIYDPRRPDNEERSADWATRELLAAGIDPSVLDRVAALIAATRHHAPPEPGDPATLVDIDLAILGADPARFDEYEEQVRAEYAFVREAEFQAGRSRILRSFLDRPSIYATPAFQARFEARARANLARSLGRWADPEARPTC